MAENQPVGTIGRRLFPRATPIPGDTHSFALVPGQGSDDNGSFQIVGNTLRTECRLRLREPRARTRVRIRATDFGTPAGQIVRAFTITVTDVNDPPTAVDDSATVVEDSAASAIDVLANDTDVDGGPKTIASVTQPANGTVVITGGGTGLTYQPDANYCNTAGGAGHVHLHAQRRLDRDRVGDGDVRRRPAGGGRRRRDGGRGRGRDRRSTCWPTTPTSTAAR